MYTWQGDLSNKYHGAAQGQGTWEPGETQQWWRLDLQTSRSVAVVRVFARRNCPICTSEQRLNGVTLAVGESDVLGNNLVCATFPNTGVHHYVDLQCPPGTTGRYVFLAAAEGSNKVMEFAEVEVFSKYFNLARACSTSNMACEVFMNAYAANSGGDDPRKGNDGNLDTNAHVSSREIPAGDTHHFWRVDLESAKDIVMVRVHNTRYARSACILLVL